MNMETHSFGIICLPKGQESSPLHAKSRRRDPKKKSENKAQEHSAQKSGTNKPKGAEI
jgi:hypothetical protein